MRTGVCLAAMAAGLVMAGSALALATGNVLFSDNFSKPSKSWHTGPTAYGKESFHAGKLRLAINPDGFVYDIPGKSWKGVASETVTADAAFVSGSKDNTTGVICALDSFRRYDAVIGSDGSYLVRRSAGSDGSSVLAHGTNRKAIHAAGNHIRVVCTSSGAIKLTVNGTRVLSTVDKHPLGKFTEAGIWAATGVKKPAVTIDFDNFKVVGK